MSTEIIDKNSEINTLNITTNVPIIEDQNKPKIITNVIPPQNGESNGDESKIITNKDNKVKAVKIKTKTTEVKGKKISKTLPLNKKVINKNVKNDDDSSASENKKKIKKTNRVFETYIVRVLKQVHPNTNISKLCMHQINEYLQILAKEITRIARNTSNSNNKMTLSSREIQHAVRVLLPGELMKHAISEGTKAVTKYNMVLSDHHVYRGNIKRKPESSAKKAGLTFSVARCDKILREFPGSKLRVGAAAPVYLAAVLEYICAEILELGGNASRDNNRVIMNTRHIFLAIFNDEELVKLTNILNIELEGSGVLSHINDKLIPGSDNDKKYKKKEPIKNESGKTIRRPHRFRPGTVALREIRKYQKSTSLLMQKAPFERSVRNIAKDITDNISIKFEHDTIKHLQSFIETRIVDICSKAQVFALYSDRTGIKVSDLKLASESLNIKIRRYDNVNGTQTEIPNPAIRRMCRRAGVKRISSRLIYGEINGLATLMLRSVVNRVINETEYRRMKTVTNEALRISLSDLGYNYIF